MTGRLSELQRLKRGYVDSSRGQIHYATVGRGEPLLLLHQSAQSWRMYARLAGILAPHHQVVAIDLPGFGESDPIPAPFEVSDIVQVVVEGLDRLGIEKVRASGHHSGATVAGELAASHPERVVAVALSGYAYRTAEERENAIMDFDRPGDQPPAPRFNLKADGSHLLRSFERISLRRWQSKVSARGSGPPHPSLVLPFDQPQARPEYTLDDQDVEIINESIVDNLRAASYGMLPTHEAVMRYDPSDRLPLIKAPTLIIQSSGPFELQYMQRASAVQKLIPGSLVATIEDGDVFVVHSRSKEYARMLIEFFESATV